MVYLWGFFTVFLWIQFFRCINSIRTGGSIGFWSVSTLGMQPPEMTGRTAILNMIWLFPIYALTTLHFLWLATESETIAEYRGIGIFVSCVWLILGLLVQLLVRFMRYLGLNI